MPGLRRVPRNRVRLLARRRRLRRRVPRRRESRDGRGSSSGASTRRPHGHVLPRGSSTTRTRRRSTSSRSPSWPPGSTISSNLPNAESSTVILIRGDLVRRYPEVNVFLAPRRARARPTTRSRCSRPSRAGSERTCSSSGSRCDTDVVLGQTGGPEYFVVIEERVTAPRFGLDLERTGEELTTWAELAVTDFPAAADHVRTGPIPGHRIAGDRRRQVGPKRGPLRRGRAPGAVPAAVPGVASPGRVVGARGETADNQAPSSAGAVDPPPVGPDPIEPPIEPPDLPDITFAFDVRVLPLALFPVRLEARFLPDNNPTEIVVRVFPDEISPIRTSPASRRPSSSCQGGTGTGSGGPPPIRPPSRRRGRGWRTSSARTARSTWRARPGPR